MTDTHKFKHIHMHVYVYMYIFIYIYISYINTRVFCAATGDTCFGWCLVAWITQPNSMQQHYNVSPCKHIMLQNQIPHCQHLLGSLIFCMEVFRGMSWLLHFSVLFICFSGCSLFFGGSPALEGLVDHHLPTPLLDHHLPLHCSLHWVQPMLEPAVGAAMHPPELVQSGICAGHADRAP